MTTLDLVPTAPTTLPALLGVERFSPIGLAELDATAALRHRVDRKYFVELDTARAVVAELDGFRALQVQGRRSTTYATTYFDTPDLQACRAHVQRRRRRWKVRTRLYVESAVCHIEVKVKDGRGATVKSVSVIEPGCYGALSSHDKAFVRTSLTQAGLDTTVADLVPAAEVRYERLSLVDPDAASKVTIDWGLTSTRGEDRTWLSDRFVLIETKGGVAPGRADRALLTAGVRARSFSKYVASMSLLESSVASNDVRALLRHHLRTTVDANEN